MHCHTTLPFSPAAPSLEEPELLEEVASIGRRAAEEASQITTREGQGQAAGVIQETQEEAEGSAAGVTGQASVVEEKMPLQTMAPPSAAGPLASLLAVIPSSSCPAVSDPSALAGDGFDEEIQRILAPLSLDAEEAGDSVDGAKDLAFLESMVAGLKEVQSRYGSRWRALKERHDSAALVEQKLKDRGDELHAWHKRQSHSVRQQESVLVMAKEELAAQETSLAEREALLDAREKEISAREGNLEVALRGKDDELEALVRQRTKDLEDGHKAALDALTQESSTQLKKISDELTAVFAAKADLDQQVNKLTEDLAGSTKEATALKEELQKAESALKEI